ncbi:MAG TPA: NAD(P)/FAD-dependent oxidoreductase [Polyangia bacterium]
MVVHDVIVVGGGPAGSTCARFLASAGLRVAVMDRAQFPRVKLCSGWLSTPVWDVLGLSPHDYSGGRWEWQTCHVRYGGEDRAIPCHGWFVRRYEFDDFLLRASGAELHLGVPVADIARDGDGWWSIAGLRARHLVGAGGTNCPVARLCPPPRPMGPVGVQEHEFRADPGAIANTRIGRDGEPELLLHDDLSGYSWNVPKTDWLNIGTGTVNPKDVRAAWQSARANFRAAGHVPSHLDAELDAMKGYTYYLYHPEHLRGAARVDDDGKGGVYLVGDSLGLAQPITAEGILPAVVSGRLLAEAIVAGAPASYPARLAAHPVLADYRRVFRLRETASALRQRFSRTNPARLAPSASSFLSRQSRHVVSAGFARLFSGAPLPAPQLIDVVLAGAKWWLDRDRAAEGRT